MFLLIAIVLSLRQSIGMRRAIQASPAQSPGPELKVDRYGTRFTGGGVQLPSRIDGAVFRGA